jgi:hypothetical protein
MKEYIKARIPSRGTYDKNSTAKPTHFYHFQGEALILTKQLEQFVL